MVKLSERCDWCEARATSQRRFAIENWNGPSFWVESACDEHTFYLVDFDALRQAESVR